MKADKIRGLDATEVQRQQQEAQEQLFRFRFQMGMGQSEGLKKYRAEEGSGTHADGTGGKAGERGSATGAGSGRGKSCRQGQSKQEEIGSKVKHGGSDRDNQEHLPQEREGGRGDLDEDGQDHCGGSDSPGGASRLQAHCAEAEEVLRP
jgi:hypothetical protein